MVIAKSEEEHFPFSAAEPVETIRLVMEGRGYRKKDLAKVLGSESRASEVLAVERPRPPAAINLGLRLKAKPRRPTPG